MERQKNPPCSEKYGERWQIEGVGETQTNFFSSHFWGKVELFSKAHEMTTLQFSVWSLRTLVNPATF